MIQKSTGARGGTFIVLILAIAGAVLILQGWKSRVPDFDAMTSIDAAQRFVDDHHVPEKGVVNSLGAFSPPGMTWLMLPGLMVFRDPRLFAYLGSVSMYIGTLFGIFFVTRRCFGRNTAVLAVLLYGFSEIGLTTGGALLHKQSVHLFFIWIVYFILRWVSENDGRWPALATLTWVVGMNVDLELAPAMLVVPVIWLMWRPAVRIVPLLLVGAMALAIWYPYLTFEKARGFADLRAVALHDPMRPIDFPSSWCNPSNVPPAWLDTAADERTWAATRRHMSVGEQIHDRFNVVASSWSANFNRTLIPGATFGLFLLALLGIAAPLVGRSTQIDAHAQAWPPRLIYAAMGLVCLAVLFNEFVLARWMSSEGVLERSSVWTIRGAQAGLLLAALALGYARNAIVRAYAHVGHALPPASRQTKALIACLAVPWCVLFLTVVSEPRFFQIWPLQLIAISVAVVYLPHMLALPRTARWLAIAAVGAVVVSNAVVVSHLTSWHRDGWAGTDAVEIEVVDTLVKRIRAHGATGGVSVGYQVDFWRFMADSNRIDKRNKVGADFDVLLRYRHGITNLNTCAEGFRPADDFRVVQIARRPMVDHHGLNHFYPEDETSFAVAGRANVYQILER